MQLSQGIIESFNPSAERIFGYKAQEIIGSNVKVLMPEPYHSEHDGYLKHHMDTGEKKIIGIGREVVAKRKDGSEFPIELGVNSFEISGKKMFVGSIHDITERKENDRIKSEFISVVSHELRTPLTSIRGSLGLIIGTFSKGLPSKVVDLIGIAHKNCERLIALINDILDMDKIAAGEMRFDMKEEALADITTQAVEANQAYAEKFNTTIKLEPIDNAIFVKMDSARYIQILSNFISNAAKFSPQNKTIDVFATKSDCGIRISVRDYGDGIPEEFHSKIFSKFLQADSSSSRGKGGTGLGLHITKQIVENMGGVVGFDTKTNQGTTFWVEFPIIKKDSATLSHKTNDSKSATRQVLANADSATDIVNNIPEVLHVEDDLDLSNLLAVAVGDKVKIVNAKTLAEARTLLTQKHFSAIILDIGMPDGSGLEILDNIPNVKNPSPPILVLSASDLPSQINEKVAKTIVKSRTSEAKIVEIILCLVEQDKKTTSLLKK